MAATADHTAKVQWQSQKSGLRSYAGWIFAIACSMALNFALFGLMPGLIQMSPSAPDKLEDLEQIHVIRVKRAEPLPKKKKKEEIKKPEPKKQLTRTPFKKMTIKPVARKPRLPFELNPKLPAAPMDLVMPGLEHFSMDGPDLKGLYNMDELDGPLTALVKVPPLYPRRAARKHIEGLVSVEFKVNKQGLVKDIVIVDAKPREIFDKSVIKCVSQWKFKPGTVEGIPVATKAQTTIRFQMEKQ
ncbi:MAG: energy transducer TonB [Desulfobacteraceae bacterium]|nr:energy transducer TonB [Desulfobacteraceae bacterium]